MLVLQRSVGQRVQIGPDIVVTVLECPHGRVRLGVEAAPDAHVRRGELEPHAQPPETQPRESPTPH